MSDAEYQALREDIGENGLKSPFCCTMVAYLTADIVIEHAAILK